MRKIEHLCITIQGFAAGSILMAYITNYNRNQLPLAIISLIFSILLRLRIMNR